MRMTFRAFVRSQWKTLPPNPNVDLTGQTVLITGSNTGLGLEAAKQFARLNPAHLVLAVRNVDKGQEALTGEHSVHIEHLRSGQIRCILIYVSGFPDLRNETGYKGGKVMKLDHADFRRSSPSSRRGTIGWTFSLLMLESIPTNMQLRKMVGNLRELTLRT
jgi:hypothetical protein